MALIVETGTGSDSSANAYVSVADSDAHFDLRGLVKPSEGQLHQAMDVLESLVYTGAKSALTNPLSFPRSGIADRNGNAYSNNVIPPEIRTAQMWLAYYISKGNNPTEVSTSSGGIKKEKVDVLETEYFPSGNNSSNGQLQITDLPNFYNAISHLLADSAVQGDTALTGRIDRA